VSVIDHLIAELSKVCAGLTAARSIPCRGAELDGPGHQQVLPLPPEFITSRMVQRSSIANAMPRSAGWPGGVAHLRPIYLGGDLFAFQR
jgi:hypothetical protein